MTPLLAALSSLTDAARIAAAAASALPASAASRNFRTDVFSSDLTALFRIRAFSFCLLRLIWDLMFATAKCLLGQGLGGLAVSARAVDACQRTRGRGASRQPGQDSRDHHRCPNRL